MKTTFVFVGDRNIKKILEGFESKINLSSEEYNIIFLSNKAVGQNLDFPNISYKVLVFDDYSTENEMIEYLFQNENLTDVIIAKSSYENVNFEDFNRILKESSKNKQVIISKQNKEKNFFTKLWGMVKNFFIKLLFGFKTYAGEADLIYLSPLAYSIVKSSPKRSCMFTNMNTWSGIDVHETTIQEQPKHKSNFKISKSSFISISIAILIFLGMIIGNVLFAVLDVNIPFLAYLAYILVEVALFGYSLFFGIKLAFVRKYGKLNFINEAVLTQTIDNLK